jgi:hypothetical protein
MVLVSDEQAVPQAEGGMSSAGGGSVVMHMMGGSVNELK